VFADRLLLISRQLAVDEVPELRSISERGVSPAPVASVSVIS
jgi:hypothetical protein